MALASLSLKEICYCKNISLKVISNSPDSILCGCFPEVYWCMFAKWEIGSLLLLLLLTVMLYQMPLLCAILLAVCLQFSWERTWISGCIIIWNSPILTNLPTAQLSCLEEAKFVFRKTVGSNAKLLKNQLKRGTFQISEISQIFSSATIFKQNFEYQ